MTKLANFVVSKARKVFAKVTDAAELVLARALPGLVDGSARIVPQDLSRGGYYGGRKPEA